MLLRMSALGRQPSYLVQLLVIACLPSMIISQNTTNSTPVLVGTPSSSVPSVIQESKTLTIHTSSPMPSASVSSSVTAPTTQSTQSVETKFAIELLDKAWSNSFDDVNSEQSKQLVHELTEALNTTLTTNNITVHHVDVERFRKGSVIADLNIITSKPTPLVKETLNTQMETGSIGSFSVTPFLLEGKVFEIPIKLKTAPADEKQAEKTLKSNISTLINATNTLLNANVNITGKQAAVTAIFKESVSLYPTKTLSKLLEQVKTGRVGSLEVESKAHPYIKYPPLTTKDFKISFVANHDCAKISSSSKEQVANDSIAGSLSVITNFKKVQKVLNPTCNDGVLNVSAIVEFQLSASDDPEKSFSPIYCKADTKSPNVTATLLTPTTLIPTKKAIIHCTPQPTTLPVSSTTPPSRTTPTTSEPQGPLKTPKLFIRMKFDMTWKEFCISDGSLKQKIAANLFDKDGKSVSKERIKFINRDRNCAEPAKQNVKPVDLWWYVTDKNQQNPDKCLTLKAMKVMKSLLDNGNTRQLGPLFSSKVISVELAGCAAPKENKPLDNITLILIIVGALLGLLLLLLACCCVCCGGRRRRRRRKYYEKSDQVEMFAVMNSGGASDKDRKKRKKRGGKAGQSDDEGEGIGNDGKGKWNGTGGHGDGARHRRRKLNQDDYDDDDYADDGCCGGGYRNNAGKRKGKKVNRNKNKKHEKGKEDINKNRRAKDDGGGKINEGMDSEDDMNNAIKGEQNAAEQDNKQPRNANNYQPLLGQSPNQEEMDGGDYAYAEVNKPHDKNSGEETQNAGSKLPIAATAGGVAAGALLAGTAASSGSPRGSPTSSKQQSLNPQDSAGYTNRVPGTTGQSSDSPTGIRGTPSGSRRGSSNLNPDRGNDGPSWTRRGSGNTSPNSVDGSPFGARRGSANVGLNNIKDSPTGGRRGSGNVSPSRVDGSPFGGRRGSANVGLDNVKDGPTGGRRGSGNVSPSRVDGSPFGARRGSANVNLDKDSSTGGRKGSSSLSPDRANDSPSGSGRGSPNLSPDQGNFNMVRPPTPAVLRHVDEKADSSRRRSSAFGLADDGSSPLTHKTATVGIVALALRNKNETKKETEFKNLDPDMPDSRHYQPATAVKNRNPDVLPSPATIVKLSKSPDYINANHVRDHKGQKRYIVTQHPLRDTITDFWQMIWDQQVKLIVMVNDEEHLQPADYPPYWPANEGENIKYGPFDITTKQVDKQPDYVKTVLNLSDAISRKGAQPLEITHFQFTSWKERDQMPNVGLFVTFITAVRTVSKSQEETNPTKPIVVHCSDGQGYTGMYVAVDIGIRSHEESSNSIIDLFEMAKKLRRDRQGIICSLEHYNFTYQCLYEYTVNIQS